MPTVRAPFMTGGPGRRGWLLAAAAIVTVSSAAIAVGVPALSGGARFGPAIPHFVDEGSAAGIAHRYDGDSNYFVGGGVAVMDCDGDGRQDVYLAGGAAPAGLYRNESLVGGTLRFTRVPSPVTDLTAVTGAYPLDLDGDRRSDLAILRLGGNVLLRGLGDCGFERANVALGFDGGSAWTAAFAATWEGDGRLPTLAFGNYVGLDPSGNATYSCPPNELVRPVPGALRYAPPTSLDPGWCALSMLFSDWSRTGPRDLRVSNDRHYYTDASGGEEQLWRIVPGEAPREYTAADGWQTVRIWGMGIASQDLDGDGYPEVYLTSQGDNKLQALADGASRPRYEDIALDRGVTAHKPYVGDTTLPSTAWHAEFQDVNNDAVMDLFVAKGNVEAMPDFAARDPSNLLLGSPDGTFVERAEAAGIMTFARGRGAALADLNLDGLLDLIEVHRRVPVGLWRNVGAGDAARPVAMGNWLSIRLTQPAPNVDAIGAWIELRPGGQTRTLDREVTVGGGHAGGQLGWIHLGLGTAASAEVRVRWPDGEVGPWLRLSANRFAILDRATAAATEWTPG
jgi:hypothetical protein